MIDPPAQRHRQRIEVLDGRRVLRTRLAALLRFRLSCVSAAIYTDQGTLALSSFASALRVIDLLSLPRLSNGG